MRAIIFSTGLLFATCAATTFAQTSDPFPRPIEAEQGVVVVEVVEHASIPAIGGQPAQMKTMVYEAGSDHLFLSDMRGLLYIIGEDGSVTEYLNMDDPRWGFDLASPWREMGLQSFAFHPQFAEQGTPGYGKFYAWADTADTSKTPDVTAGGDASAHHTVLLEWSATDAMATSYAGSNPREIARFEQPFANHNGGEIAFNPLAGSGDEDYGLLYIGVGDGGSGGDPLELGQNMMTPFGKILRIDPLGRDSGNSQYGIPQSNPFVGSSSGAMLEIYASGLRNPQHLAWDSATGTMMVADIGQNVVEKVSIVEAGDNLGWNTWEGSFRFLGGDGVSTENPRSEDGIRFPFAEYDHTDPLLGRGSAVTGLEIVRNGAIPALEGRVLFGELASGELFHVSADNLPEGGSDALRRVLFSDGSGGNHTFLELVQAKNEEQGSSAAQRADLRLGRGPDGTLYLLNKYDSTLRRVSAGM